MYILSGAKDFAYHVVTEHPEADVTLSPMSDVIHILRKAALLLAFLVSTASFEQPTQQPQKVDILHLKLDDKVLGSKYDVLGLKLGMNADETRKILGERFHVKERVFNGKADAYSSQTSSSRFVPGKEYTNQIILSVSGISVFCQFVDIDPGEGKGPEMLWLVDYTPTLVHDPDKQAFIDSVHQKFGKPQDENSDTGVWGDVAYTRPTDPHLTINLLKVLELPEILDNAGLPELELSHNREGGFSLKLSNDAIPRHMNAVFLAKKTTTPPI